MTINCRALPGGFSHLATQTARRNEGTETRFMVSFAIDAHQVIRLSATGGAKTRRVLSAAVGNVCYRNEPGLRTKGYKD